MSESDDLRAALAAPELPAAEGWELARGEAQAPLYAGDAQDGFRRGQHTWLWLSDASSSGFAAAALALQARAALRVAVDSGASPAGALKLMNRALHPLSPPEGFVAGVLVRLEADTHTLTWSSAGGEALWIYRAAAARVEQVLSGGVVLGAVAEPPEAVDHELTLAPGDALLLASDGLNELRRPDQTFVGPAEISAALVECARGASAAELVAGVLAWADAVRASGEPEDDLSLLALKRSD